MPDPFSILIEDHREVERLFQQFAQTNDPEVAVQICDELTVHAMVEEELVYPLLATKVGLEPKGGGVVRNASRQRVFQEVEDSLRRLRTDYIDLYQVHWPDAATPHEETAGALVELKRQGKIRAIGVSNYSIPEMARFA